MSSLDWEWEQPPVLDKNLFMDLAFITMPDLIDAMNAGELLSQSRFLKMLVLPTPSKSLEISTSTEIAHPQPFTIDEKIELFSDMNVGNFQIASKAQHLNPNFVSMRAERMGRIFRNSQFLENAFLNSVGFIIKNSYPDDCLVIQRLDELNKFSVFASSLEIPYYGILNGIARVPSQNINPFSRLPLAA